MLLWACPRVREGLTYRAGLAGKAYIQCKKV